MGLVKPLVLKNGKLAESNSDDAVFISGGSVFSPESIVEHTMTGDTNDLAIADIDKYSILNITNTAFNYDLTGLVPFDTVNAWRVYVFNHGSKNTTLLDNSGSSSPDNRFLLGGNIALNPDEGVLLIYNPTVNRWMSPGRNN